MRTARAASRLTPRKLELTRFDGLVMAVMIALTAAIVGVVLRGDRVGVTVKAGDYGPVGSVRGAAAVRVRFSEAMDRASVEARLHIDPALAGQIAWSDARTLIFTPAEAFAAGQTYTVTLDSGALASGRHAALADDLRWTFQALLPRVVYLGPAHAYVRNLMLADLESGAITPLTNSSSGVEDFAVRPDGRAIVYSQTNPDHTSDLWLLDLAAGQSRPLTRCVNAVCSAPAWTPDGSRIVYQRQEFNTGQAVGSGEVRAWIVDPETLQTGLLFDDPQQLGAEPLWSPDGQRVAVFDAASGGIRVHDLQDGTDTIIPSQVGSVGVFSPDGSRLVYPVLVRGAVGDTFYTHLEMVEFAAQERVRLSGEPDAAVEDGSAAWSPDGTRLVIARRYLDERYTLGRQLYLFDPASGEAQPLVVETDYTHAAMHWDASGRYVVYQRFSVLDPDTQPEVWLVDVVTGETRQIAPDAFFPAWLP